MKTITPKRIALQAALLTALAISVLFVIPAIVWIGLPEGLFFVPVPFLLFGVNYWLFYWLMEKYIDQKIKLIYRTIHAEKIGRPLSTMRIDMNTDVFREVNRNVENWAQDYRKEIQQLKDQAQFRREFIGNLSHELKTPITIIQGNILTLLEGAVEDKFMRERFLVKAAENVERLESLIKDLDSVTKLESGAEMLNIESFNIVELVKDVVENLSEKATKSEIELKIGPKTKREIMVEGDKYKIDQVVTNLIANSINYGVKGGKTNISFDALGDNILVEIKDNGVGIEEADVPRLFERFYRVDKSRSRNAGGTGLGLAIVKHIIDAHHQTINVTSKPGKGSTFSFTLAKG
jgi:two-component system phosphate regulon sensor histidine kinase PhoR